jgi:hypothetical protein
MLQSDSTGCGSDGKRNAERGSDGRMLVLGAAARLGEESPDKWGQAERMVAGRWGRCLAGCGGRVRGSGWRVRTIKTKVILKIQKTFST